MAQDPSAALTAEQKLAIQEYLASTVTSWLKLFGFASLGALLVALVGGGYYVFFVLPGQAVETAKAQLQGEIAAISGDLTQKLADQLVTAGSTQEKLARLDGDLQSTSDRISTIKTNLAAVDESTLAEAAKFVAALKGANQVSDLIARVEKIENRKLCYCLDARYNGESCNNLGNWTEFRGDGKTPDRIRIFYCD